MKPTLYIHVGGATHFLRWELPEFEKYFNIVDKPDKTTPMLVFGPDVLQEAAQLPALKRFAILFPGFGHNPLYNPVVKQLHFKLIKDYYELVFINPGPLEIAYNGLRNIEFYPFSIDTSMIKLKSYRKKLDSLLHVSSDYPQKDWRRSEEVMKQTDLKYEVFPPRDKKWLDRNKKTDLLKRRILLDKTQGPPSGYVNHRSIVKKYQQYDGFVHVAKDIKDPKFIDGKYTASLIEAGVTGALLFWHDTFELGNSLETVFEMPLDPAKAAERILDIRTSVDIEKRSKETREEMLNKFNVQDSVANRAKKILNAL